jgi:hypothetical protein
LAKLSVFEMSVRTLRDQGAHVIFDPERFPLPAPKSGAGSAGVVSVGSAGRGSADLWWFSVDAQGNHVRTARPRRRSHSSPSLLRPSTAGTHRRR